MLDPIESIPSDVLRWMVASAAAGLVAVAGMRADALTLSGALAAALVGTTLVGAGGWWTGGLIVVFFVTSSALSRLGHDTQASIQPAKGGRRDAAQVLANGGIPMLLTVAAGIASDREPWLLAAAAAIAAASGDTWATEIGRTSPKAPRMITTWREAPSGSSGAISGRGTLGALAGAGTIGLAASVGSVTGWWLPDLSAVSVMSIVSVTGFAGTLVDSILGATVQAQYWCPTCDVLSEQPLHRCGTSTDLRHGFSPVTNDVVNAAAVSASAVAALGWHWLS